MGTEQTELLVMQHKKLPALFSLCWITYFSTYLGRGTFAALLAEILRSERFSAGDCGLVGTGFFICYGIGQLFSGLAGDHIHPRLMVFWGVLVSGLVNLLMSLAVSPAQMLMLWCVNGAFQSFTWSPIVRTIAEYFPPDTRKDACLRMSVTYPAGLLVTYLLCALSVRLWGWRAAFRLVGSFLLLTAVAWRICFSRLERWRTVHVPVSSPATSLPSGHNIRSLRSLLALPGLGAALLLVALSLALQGALRDGIMTWVPSYLADSFPVSTSFSILCTTILPLINLAGVYAAGLVNRRLHCDEVLTSGLFFFSAAVFSLLLMLFGLHSLWLSVLLFALVTTSMMGVNIMLVSFLPTYFIRWNRVSFMSGAVNATVYIGSSISIFVFGKLTERFGWHALLAVIFLLCLTGAALCTAGSPFWKRFLNCAAAEPFSPAAGR